MSSTSTKLLNSLRDLEKLAIRVLRANDRQFLILLENAMRILEELSRILNDYTKRFRLSELSAIRKRICFIMRKLLSRNVQFSREDVIMKFLHAAKCTYQVGCVEQALRIFEKILDIVYKNTVSFEILAEFVDKAFECGLLDMVIEVLRKIREYGYESFEITYNLALAYYLAGETIKAEKILKESERKYGEKRQTLGLLSAIYIAMGEFEKASKILETLR
ncbi:MAG: tetratricopeptide repeat protein [Candidatus Njordarchaeales archaeon]